MTLEFMVWVKTYLPPLDNVTAVTHYKAIDYYTESNPDDIRMIQIHRGWGKTTWNMMFSLFCVCEGYEDYVLFVAGTQDQANDIIGDAQMLLEDGTVPVSVIRAVEGVIEVKRSDGSYGVLVGKSTGSKLRGIRKKMLRPTLIMLDDIVSDDLVQNSLRVQRANRWVTGALMPTLAPGGKMFGSGTPLRKGDPFLTLCDSFGCYKIPLSPESFPDRFTEDYINRRKSQYEKLGQLRSWKREMELVLADDESRLFDMSKVVYVDSMPEDVTCYMTCDLAFSEKTSADYSAIVVNGVDKDGNWYIYPVRGRWKPSKTASVIMELKDQFNVLDVGIEGGSSYIAVREHLDSAMLEYQSWFNVNELKHGGNSKFSRVASLEPVVNSGRLHIVDNGEDAEALVEEMELTDNVSINSEHDDLIDALAYQVLMPLFYDDKPVVTRADYEYMHRPDTGTYF